MREIQKKWFQQSSPLLKIVQEKLNRCPCFVLRNCPAAGRLRMLSRCYIQLFATPQTGVPRAPLSMRFPRQEYWSGVLCPPPGDLPHPGTEPASLSSPALAGGLFTSSATWEAQQAGAFSINLLLPESCSHLRVIWESGGGRACQQQWLFVLRNLSAISKL